MDLYSYVIFVFLQPGNGTVLLFSCLLPTQPFVPRRAAFHSPEGKAEEE